MHSSHPVFEGGFRVPCIVRWPGVIEAGSVTDELVESRYAIYAQPGRAATVRKIAEASIGALLIKEVQQVWNTEELMKKIPVPTLLLWTRYNPGQLVPLAEQGATLIPDCELIILENSAHWPQWEEPEEFNRVHIEYLLK